MSTPKFSFLQWVAAMASPWTAFNNSIFKIDQLLQINVKDVSLVSPPGSETEGDAYIVASPAVGAWAGQENNLAMFINSGYEFIPLTPGSLIYNDLDSKYYNWNGTDIGELNIARI